MKEIRIKAVAGSFAENKDSARRMRIREILPALNENEEVTLNFEGVDAVTQSFVHALISDVIKHDSEALDKIYFKNCNKTIQKIIEIVVEYTQE